MLLAGGLLGRDTQCKKLKGACPQASLKRLPLQAVAPRPASSVDNQGTGAGTAPTPEQVRLDFKAAMKAVKGGTQASSSSNVHVQHGRACALESAHVAKLMLQCHPRTGQTYGLSQPQ